MSQTQTIEAVPETRIHIPVEVFANQEEAEFEPWQKEIQENGYAVIKGAVPLERAEAYRNEMYEWLEDFDLGFKRDDPSTIHKDKLPLITEKGMCLAYAVTHEKFVWDVRTEPKVLETFQKVYNDKDLIVSFDAVGFGFPNRKDLPPNKPWPHQDQDPTKPGFRVMQGLVNLFPNGPNDGGLIVCRGGHKLSARFHEEMSWETPIPAWNPEWYGFTTAGLEWLSSHGCEWVKVCAEPGDLVLWDSRTPHYNLSSTTATPRFCVYTCYMPVKDATQEELKRKRDAYENWLGTTHWPNCQVVGSNVAMRDGEPDPANRSEPRTKPVLDDVGLKLTGIPYIRAEA